MVNVQAASANYGVINGGTFQVNATDDFQDARGGTGTINGSIAFSKTVEAVFSQSLSNLFVFSDGRGGNFNFSGTTVQTVTFASDPSSTSGSFNVFGSVLNNGLGVSPTASTLLISFNSTGGSPYSSSATLAIGGQAPAVPEPATWAMMLVGFGMIGATARYRRRGAKVSFA